MGVPLQQKWVNNAIARRSVWNQVTSRKAASDGSSPGGRWDVGTKDNAVYLERISGSDERLFDDSVAPEEARELAGLLTKYADKLTTSPTSPRTPTRVPTSPTSPTSPRVPTSPRGGGFPTSRRIRFRSCGSTPQAHPDDWGRYVIRNRTSTACLAAPRHVFGGTATPGHPDRIQLEVMGTGHRMNVRDMVVMSASLVRVLSRLHA